MADQSARIMVVDDEATARVSLAEILRLEGYQVDTAASGEEALSLLKKGGPFDLMVLDIKMPGMSGLDVTKSVQKQSPDTTIVLLTAFGKLETAIEAIRNGASDYLLKPAAVPDILESVRNGLVKHQQMQRRQHLVSQLQQTLSELVAVEGAEVVEEEEAPQPSRFVQIRDIVIDRQKHVVTQGGALVDLTPTEFKILACLMETPDRVWSPQELVRHAQGYETDAWGARAIIRVHVRRLRKKMEADPSDPTYILNMRGVGYMFSGGEPEGDSR
jgi:two-component system KDP operon response regulator KdpE